MKISIKYQAVFILKRFVLLMSLLSILFGCGKKANKAEQYAQVPLFPQTDNQNCRITAFQPDRDFVAQTFILSPDKKNVFLATYGQTTTSKRVIKYADEAHTEPLPESPAERKPDIIPYQILKLDMDGNVLEKIVLPNCIWVGVPLFWWENEGNLSLKLADYIKTFEPVHLAIVKTWQEISQDNFLSQKKLTMMEFHEKEDAYYLALQTAIKKSTLKSTRKFYNLDYIMLDFAGKNAEYWYLYPNRESTDIMTKYGENKAPMNPPTTFEKDLLTDGTTHLTVLANNVLDAKYVWASPHIKYSEERIMEITMGKQKIGFKLVNKDNHSLSFHCADNDYLTTANGAVWLMYEAVLYRIEMHPRH